MTQYITCLDFTDGSDRESWSVFYCDMYISATQEEAEFIGQYELAVHWNEVFDEEGEYYEEGDYHIVTVT